MWPCSGSDLLRDFWTYLGGAGGGCESQESCSIHTFLSHASLSDRVLYPTVTANTPITKRASGSLGMNRSPGFHALKDPQLPLKVESVPKRLDSGGVRSWVLFLGSTQPSLQMQSPCVSTTFEDLLPTPYPALVPPGLNRNLAALLRKPSFLQIDGFSLDP